MDPLPRLGPSTVLPQSPLDFIAHVDLPSWTRWPPPGGGSWQRPPKSQTWGGAPHCPPSNTPKHRALPAGHGRRVPPRMQLANHPGVSLWESQPPALFGGQPRTPSPSLCRGHCLVRMDWPGAYADQDVTGPKGADRTSPQWSERPKGSRQEALLRASPGLGARANSAFRGAPSTSGSGVWTRSPWGPPYKANLLVTLLSILRHPTGRGVGRGGRRERKSGGPTPQNLGEHPAFTPSLLNIRPLKSFL